eukprot:2892046-Amphidinium_carterae.1
MPACGVPEAVVTSVSKARSKVLSRAPLPTSTSPRPVHLAPGARLLHHACKARTKSGKPEARALYADTLPLPVLLLASAKTRWLQPPYKKAGQVRQGYVRFSWGCGPTCPSLRPSRWQSVQLAVAVSCRLARHPSKCIELLQWAVSRLGKLAIRSRCKVQCPGACVEGPSLGQRSGWQAQSLFRDSLLRCLAFVVLALSPALYYMLGLCLQSSRKCSL